MGRFLSRDTWAYNYQNPIELNRYGYTANNPINGFDPSGHNYALGLLPSVPSTASLGVLGGIVTGGLIKVTAVTIIATAIVALLVNEAPKRYTNNIINFEDYLPKPPKRGPISKKS